jgi:hypothetical protein
MKISSNESIGNKEGRQVIWQRTPINIIFPICFLLNPVENRKYDSSSEAHPQSSKTSRGSDLAPELSLFCRNIRILSRDPDSLSEREEEKVAVN